MRRKPRSHWLLQLMVTSHQRWSNHVILTLLPDKLKTHLNITTKGQEQAWLPPRLDNDLVRDCLQRWLAGCVSGRGRTAAVRSEEVVGGLGSQAGALPSKQRHRPPDCVLSFRASLQTSDQSGMGVCWRESWPVKSNISSYQGLLTTQLHLFQVICFYLYSHQPRNW